MMQKVWMAQDAVDGDVIDMSTEDQPVSPARRRKLRIPLVVQALLWTVGLYAVMVLLLRAIGEDALIGPVLLAVAFVFEFVVVVAVAAARGRLR